jgi:hypothetical protein
VVGGTFIKAEGRNVELIKEKITSVPGSDQVGRAEGTGCQSAVVRALEIAVAPALSCLFTTPGWTRSACLYRSSRRRCTSWSHQLRTCALNLRTLGRFAIDRRRHEECVRPVLSLHEYVYHRRAGPFAGSDREVAHRDRREGTRRRASPGLR